MRGPAFFAYANNYLIDVKFGVIVDVEYFWVGQVFIFARTLSRCDGVSLPMALISAAIRNRSGRQRCLYLIFK